MDHLGLALRWIHILSAVLLGGGIYFWHFVILRASFRSENSTFQQVTDAFLRPWSRIVMITSALLLITGLVNFVRTIVQNQFPDEPYHLVGGIKLLLALIVFFISARLAGRSEAAVRARATRMEAWSLLNVLMVTTLIILASWMRYMPREPKPPEAENSAAAANDVRSSNDMTS